MGFEEARAGRRVSVAESTREKKTPCELEDMSTEIEGEQKHWLWQVHYCTHVGACLVSLGKCESGQWKCKIGKVKCVL